MRRIYESNALRRDDDDPAVPNELDGSDHPQAMRSLNSSWLSRWLLPRRVRRWAVTVSLSTPRTEYPVGSSVPFSVTMKNTMPFPVSIPTVSPVLWTWRVDGLDEASRIPQYDPPRRGGRFRFDRGERKRFRKRWNGTFRVAEDEWAPAEPGEHTIGAGINVADGPGEGLSDETTIRLVPK